MTIALAAILDTPAAGPLRTALMQAAEKEEPLLIDGGMVERIGQACLQVLLAGRDAAARTGIDFRIDAPSPALAEMATLAGLGTLVNA